MSYSQRFIDALLFAAELHQDQLRKGTAIPYITHLMAVASIVGQYDGTEDQVIAALLHDAVEDRGGAETLARIRHHFGDDVARIVAQCSDTDLTPKPPWRERKEAFIARTRDFSPDVKLIVAADKLHNVRCITADLYQIGGAVWSRFSGGRNGTLWYHAEMLRALSAEWSHPLLHELAEAVDTMHRQDAVG